MNSWDVHIHFDKDAEVWRAVISTETPLGPFRRTVEAPSAYDLGILIAQDVDVEAVAA